MSDGESSTEPGRFDVLFMAEVPYLAIDGAHFEFPAVNNAAPSVRLVLNRSTETRTYDGLLSAAEGLWPQEAFASIVHIVRSRPQSVAVWLVTATGTPDTEAIEDLFWRDCLSVLDEVSFAYRVVTGSGVGEVGPYHISSPVFYATFDRDERTGPVGVLLRSDDREDDALASSNLEDLTGVAVARFRGEPMFEWRRWLERAKDDFSRGFFGPAVISLQTGVESFFSDLRRMLLLDAKDWTECPPMKSLKPSFSALVQSVGGLLRAGNWDTSAVTPLGQYWHDLYLLRNEVIHTSKRPSQDEVAAAFISHDVMRDWLRDLLLQQPRRFPRTLLAFPGAHWLRSTGHETSFLRTVMSRYAQVDNPYWTDG